MPYSTVPDVRTALTPNGDPWDSDTASSYSDEQITDSIARADAQIDLYLRTLYTVPVATPDALLRDWSSSIAAYLATLVQSGGNDIEKTDPIQLRYDRVIAQLKDVAASLVSLPYPPATEETAGDPVVVNRIPDGFSVLDPEFFAPGDLESPYGYRRADGTWYSEA